MAYSDEVLADTPRIYWRLNETTGTTVTDSSGGSRNGTWVPNSGGTLGVAGLLTDDTDTAYSNSSLTSPAHINYSPPSGTWIPGNGGAFTLELWVKPSAFSSNSAGGNALIGRDTLGVGGGSRVFQVVLGGDGAIQVAPFNNGSYLGQVDSPAGATAVGETTHIVITNGGSSGNGIRIYANGVLVKADDTRWITTSSSDTYGMKLFTHSNLSYTRAYRGVIDEFATYDYVLSAARVEAHYNAGLTPGPPPAPTAPGVPTLKAAPWNGQVALGWNAPASNGDPITDYVIEYRTSPSGSWTTFSDGTSTVRSAVVTGLTNGTAYDFRVAAVNGIGQGDWSATVTATPAVLYTEHAAAIEIVPAAAPLETDGVVTREALPAAPDRELTEPIEIIPAVAPLETDGVVTRETFPAAPDRLFTEPIEVIPAVAPYSFDPATRTASAIPPGAPVGLTATPTDTTVDLEWSIPSLSSWSAVTGFSVEQSTDGGTTWTTLTADAGVVSEFEVTGLTSETAYSFRVRSLSDAGPGGSATVATTTLTEGGSVVSASGDAEISLAATAAAGTTSTASGDAEVSLLTTAVGGTISLPAGSADITLTGTAEADTINRPTAPAEISIAATAHVTLTQAATLAGVLDLTGTAEAATRLPYGAAAAFTVTPDGEARTLSRPDADSTVTITPGTTQADTYSRPTAAALVTVAATAQVTSRLPVRLTAEITVTPGDAAARTLSRPALPATVTVSPEADAATYFRPTAAGDITLIPNLLDPRFLFRPSLAAAFRLATTVTATDGRTRPPNDGLPNTDIGVWLRLEAEAHAATITPIALPPDGLIDPLADTDETEEPDDAPPTIAAWVDEVDEDEDDLAPGGWVLTDAADEDDDDADWGDLVGDEWVLTGADASSLTTWDEVPAVERAGFMLPAATGSDGPARRPLTRVSPIMSVNEDSDSPRPTLVVDQTKTRVVGWVRVVIGGRDVTWLRGTPTRIDNLEWEEPFGPLAASITFPQVSPLEQVGPRGMGLKGTGPLGWLRPGMDVEIDLVNARGRKVRRLWEGFVMSLSERATGADVSVTVEAQGALWQADHVLKQPELIPRTEDIGVLVAQALNQVPGRRYKKLARKKTGIEVFERGEWEPILSGWVGGLLADSTTDNTRDMWTVVLDPGRKPRLVKKSRTGRAWRVTMGAPGVDISIDRDLSERVTQVYGQGTDERGHGWGNLKLPALQSQATEWPFSSPTATMSIGTSDGYTRNGRGVTELQERLVQLGYPTPVTGSYSVRTADAVRGAQQDLGVTVTGVVNGQTWVAIMDPGSAANGGKSALDTAYYAPLAGASRTEPWIYNAAGGIKRPNPNFNPRHIRVERFHRYSEGVSLKEAKRSARKELRRDLNGYRTGTITLETCPENGSRWSIRAGDWVKVQGWHNRWPGDDRPATRVLVMRVVKVVWLDEGTKVSLTVDEGLRDAATLDAVMERDRVAQTVSRRRAAVRKPTQRPPVDSELVGVVPRIPLTAGTWTVIRVPVGFDATIARINLKTKRSPSPFAVAFFANKITPARLARLVPNPLARNDEDPYPFPGDEATAEALRALGWIDTIGTPGQAAGYWPGRQDDDDPVTGKLVDDAGLYVESLRPPWVWVAFYAPNACFIEGRLQPAPTGW